MTRGNVDLVRAVLAEWARADFRSVSWAHEEIEYVVIGGPEPGKWDGLAAMTASVRDFMSAWEDYGIKAEGFRELDDERVLVLVQLSGRGKASGLEIGDTDARGAEIWHVSDGRVTRLVMYWHRDDALAALGLTE
ncbi:MAG TPA: nuclear transport factor 2 family protein [Solirubrobacteraceae bacterium]|nr:nuclear transport factor 2 family protein [Solirubrobacteraceae bacterium]